MGCKPKKHSWLMQEMNAFAVTDVSQRFTQKPGLFACFRSTLICAEQEKVYIKRKNGMFTIFFC